MNDPVEPINLSLHNVGIFNDPLGVPKSALKSSQFFISPSQVGMCNVTGGNFLTFDFPVQLPGPAGTKYAVVLNSPSPNDVNQVRLQWPSPATTGTLSTDYVGYSISFTNGVAWSESSIYNALWLHFDCAA